MATAGVGGTSFQSLASGRGVRYIRSFVLLLPLVAGECEHQLYRDALRDPCVAQMTVHAPETFAMVFGTNYGSFTATCRRAYAPVWVDRVYNLLLNGYYDDSYFPRVVSSERLSIVQFGTNGVPAVSNVYNFTTPRPCSIIEPQPPEMPRNVDIAPLSNTYGTIAMSTSYNDSTETTWNATAELFINTANNSWLDASLFVPICTVDEAGMRSVLAFPSFGELAELGGPGPSLGMLYQDGNAYIEANPKWATMAKSDAARAVCDDIESLSTVPEAMCGPCVDERSVPASSIPYTGFSATSGGWTCPAGTVDSCATPAAQQVKASKLGGSRVAAAQHAEL